MRPMKTGTMEDMCIILVYPYPIDSYDLYDLYHIHNEAMVPVDESFELIRIIIALHNKTWGSHHIIQKSCCKFCCSIGLLFHLVLL